MHSVQQMVFQFLIHVRQSSSGAYNKQMQLKAQGSGMELYERLTKVWTLQKKEKALLCSNRPRDSEIAVQKRLWFCLALCSHSACVQLLLIRIQDTNSAGKHMGSSNHLLACSPPSNGVCI